MKCQENVPSVQSKLTSREVLTDRTSASAGRRGCPLLRRADPGGNGDQGSHRVVAVNDRALRGLDLDTPVALRVTVAVAR